MHSAEVTQAVEEVEKRAQVRRASDRWMIGLLAAAVLTIFGAGMAWQSAKAESGAKLDRTEFNEFVSGYKRDRATDSLRQTYRDSVIVGISRKQDKIACKLHVGDCE